jgi:hypothetical protein
LFPICEDDYLEAGVVHPREVDEAVKTDVEGLPAFLDISQRRPLKAREVEAADRLRGFGGGGGGGGWPDTKVLENFKGGGQFRMAGGWVMTEDVRVGQGISGNRGLHRSGAFLTRNG